MASKDTNTTRELPKWRKYLKSLGIVGFAFFLVKGIVWILIFLGIGKYFR